MSRENPTQKTPHTNADFDSIVIGAGAAGLMCAAQLGFAGMRTLVLDHANKVGKKILMSGGGRCNFTNYDIAPDNYLSQNTHFCKSALSRYTQWDFLDLIHKHQVPFHEKTKGQLFCDNKAKDILNMLLAECGEAGARINTHTSIESVTANEHGYALRTNQGTYKAKTLVIATGGLSIPTMGATGFGYDIAKQFGLKATAKHASLVPFTLAEPYLSLAQQLAGLSIAANITVNNTSFQDQILFTHKGLSGPAVLQISNYWWPEDTLIFDLCPEFAISELLIEARAQGNKKSILNLLSEKLPKRFVTQWLALDETLAVLAEKTAAQLQHKEQTALCDHFHHWALTPKGTEGYKTAEVTRGGVHTDEVSSKTFESKKQPGLYFIGEVLDVTGWLGGFNFQWAWASGWCAAKAIAEQLRSDTIVN